MLAARLVEHRATAASTRVRTMAAAIITGPRRLRLEMVPVPGVAASQVRVRVAGCVVSPLDTPAWRGTRGWRYPLMPGEPGVEAWGVAEAVGHDVKHIAEGDRVAMVTRQGFAELAVSEADQVVRIEAGSEGRRSKGEVVAATTLGRAMNVWRRAGGDAGLGRGERVAVLGMGMVGLAVVQLAAGAGADVVAVSRRQQGLRWAKQCGATEAIQCDRLAGTEATLSELTRGRGFTRVIEASGAGGLTRLAGRIVSRGGRLVLAGGSAGAAEQERDGTAEVWQRADVELVSGRIRDPRSAIRGMHEALHAIADGRLRPDELQTQRFTLPGLGKAMEIGGGERCGPVRTWVAPCTDVP
ncbi:MAG: zinc-binding dehydrogenase [Phycisphaeraceae bacterium]